MNNSIRFQLEKLAETIEKLKRHSCDFDVHGGWTAENIEKLDVDALATSISEHVENYQNQELANISRALKSMRLAINCSDSTDKNLSRHARKLLKSWCHPMPNLRSSANNFANLIDQIKISDEVKFDDFVPVCDEYRLAKIVDIKQLRYVGKTLDNCVADYEHANRYMNKYRDGEILIWTLLTDWNLLKVDEPIYLLTVDKRDNNINEFKGKDCRVDSKIELPYELAIGILNKLNATADHVEEFIEAGAFSRFKSGRPETTPIEIDNIEIWVWSYHSELIVGIDSNSDGNLSWSHFDRPFKDSEFESYNGIELGRLFDLAIQSKPLMDKLIYPTHH